MSNKTPIKVKIRDTQEILFEGEVDRISSFNEVGRFDVFPMHANFISIIRDQLELFANHQKVKELKIEQAVMKVKQDTVHIFVGMETLLVGEETPHSQAATSPPKDGASQASSQVK